VTIVMETIKSPVLVSIHKRLGSKPPRCSVTPPKGRAHYNRKLAAGKARMEAMGALKRRLSDIVYHQMILDHRAAQTGPGGHVGAATGSSAAGFKPSTGSSEKSLPGPSPGPQLRSSAPCLPAARPEHTHKGRE